MGSCKYCDGAEGESPTKFLHIKPVNFGELGKGFSTAAIYDDSVLDFAIRDIHRSFKIKYCPMCGRKLSPEKE